MEEERIATEEYVKRCKAYTASVEASFDKSRRYNEFVLLIGYGSFFAIWKFLEDDLSRGQRLWSAAFMSTSLLIFVLWEIGRMAWDMIQADVDYRQEMVRFWPYDSLAPGIHRRTRRSYGGHCHHV